MKYHFKIHKEKKGYWAECVELSGCVTEGDTLTELNHNMEDALNLYLEEPEDSSFLAPLPKKNIQLTKTIKEISVDPAIALAYSIRKARIEKGLSQKEAAKKLGMKNIYSYQRLEKSCNPSFQIIEKLMELFPKLSLDAIFR